MIAAWQIKAAFVAGVAAVSFASGYQVRDWMAAEADADRADANTDALAQELADTRQRAQEAAQRALEATVRVDSLQSENALLRANLSQRAVDVEISDPCSQCRLGADAVGLLIDTASGSSGDPERKSGTRTDP